jgi:hypothetical protein
MYFTKEGIEQDKWDNKESAVIGNMIEFSLKSYPVQ